MSAAKAPVSSIIELILLGALWGGSFLLMRIAVPEFGAFALAEARVAIAALFLLIFVFWRKQHKLLWQHRRPLGFVGLFNSAIPFCLICWATLSISAGLASIINATAPLFTAVIAVLVYRQRFTPIQLIGLVAGFAGVAVLMAEKASVQAEQFLPAIGAGLLAALCYGIAVNYSKHQQPEMPAMVAATGSQVSAAIALMPLAVIYWPDAIPSFDAWLAAALLGIFCTSIAYILYFRLIAQVGPQFAISVTYLVPLFGVGWGWMILGETLTLISLIAGAIIVASTMLVNARKKARMPVSESGSQRG